MWMELGMEATPRPALHLLLQHQVIQGSDYLIAKVHSTNPWVVVKVRTFSLFFNVDFLFQLFGIWLCIIYPSFFMGFFLFGIMRCIGITMCDMIMVKINDTALIFYVLASVLYQMMLVKIGGNYIE